MELKHAKQEAFCVNIAKGMNNTDAYKAAGYKVKSDTVAQVNGSRLLARPDIAARVKELAAEVHVESIMSIQECQKQLTKFAKREPLPGSTEDESVRPTVAEATKAIELLMRAQGGFLDKQQVELTGALPVFIKDDVSE